ncbi:MAG: Cysteine protease Prp, partial [Bacillota bacterium]
MIQVSIIRSNQLYRMMKVTGHANSAPYGEDLVCAAVSA